NDKPLYETLLVPTKLYGKPILNLIKEVNVNGIAHITGGGLIENVPRILPKGLAASINKSDIRVPEIMQELQKRANITDDEMFGTFNMGVGLIVVVSPDLKDPTLSKLKEMGEDAYEIGRIIKSEKEIEL